MGLIKVIGDSAKGIFADQWKEFFFCDSLDNSTLIVKGSKRASKNSSNTKGNDNIISNGSVIAVADGQCMLIVDQGKVVEVCAEPGEYTYDKSSEHSIFQGNLKESVVGTFNNFLSRVSFGGDTGKDQKVYYINLKEILGNKYGTPTPIPFRVVDRNIGLDIDVSVRCNGEFSYSITDPILFYTNISGNGARNFDKSQMESIMKTELLTALQPAFAKISAKGVRYSEVPMHTMEISDILNEILSEKWQATRGIMVISFGINSISMSKEDEEMIKQLQRTSVMRDASMGAATLVEAQAEALKSAAKNESQGPLMAFAGMNIAQQQGANSQIQNLYGMAAMQQQQQQQQQVKATEGSWKCSCGAENSGKFCTECASPKPAESGWNCICGAVNGGKFCQECGKPKPQGAPLYVCDKCGFKPEDPTNPPKFCPECGDRFDQGDIK